MEGFGIYFLIVFVIVGFVVYEYNFCTRLRNKCFQSKSSIDVFLTQRFDLIPNLVEVVKGYAKYEKETLMEITKLRRMYDKSKEFRYSTRLNNELNTMVAVAEAVPELKANEQFLSLQAAIQDVEEHLAASRRMYNSNVSIYNDLVLSFPSNLIGNMINAGKMEYFNAKEEERENINITL